uniref:SFRICE_001932 n=1 Tax=Spodoptera frugiperda TaxID=7108 RepID=A0A2H1W3V5_SPOFR
MSGRAGWCAMRTQPSQLSTRVQGIKFLKSRRGKVIMMVNTFPFCEESKLRDKVIWRCTSKKTNCKARIHMLGSNVVAVKGMHNHPPRALCLPPRRPNARKGVEPMSTPVSVTAPVTTLDALALQSPEIE